MRHRRPVEEKGLQKTSYSSRKGLRSYHNLCMTKAGILFKMMRSNKTCFDGISRKLDTVDSVGIPPKPRAHAMETTNLRLQISPIHIGAQKNYWFFTDMEMAR